MARTMRVIPRAKVFLLLLFSQTACGGGETRRNVLAAPDAGADAARASGGTAGASGIDGGSSRGGIGGSGGVDASLPEASMPDASPPDRDASTDAAIPDARAEGGVDAALPQEPLIDGGTGCVGPGPEPLLSPEAAGLPKDGLALWLRADHGVYLTAASRVCAWVDQSGAAHVFRKAGSGLPLWEPTTIGGRPAVHFDASSTFLTTGGVLGIPPTSGRTLVAVVELVSTTGRFTAIMQGQSGTAGTYVNLDTNTFQTQGSREGVYVTNNAYDSSLATSTAPRVHVFTVDTLVPGTPVLGAIDYRVDGTALTLTRTPGGLGNGNIEDFSSANFTLVGSGPNAIVAEVLLYDRPLTVAERGTVEAALKSRYLIP